MFVVSLIPVDPVFQQMITDYHKHLESALCNHSNQYLANGGQGHILDTDIDLLLFNQAQLHNTLQKFEKQSVLSDHNLYKFKNSPQHVDHALHCHRNHNIGRTGLNNTNASHYQTNNSGFGPRMHMAPSVQKQWNVNQGKSSNDLHLQNGDPRTFDVNSWYDNYYAEESVSWRSEGSSAVQNGRYMKKLHVFEKV